METSFISGGRVEVFHSLSFKVDFYKEKDKIQIFYEGEKLHISLISNDILFPVLNVSPNN